MYKLRFSTYGVIVSVKTFSKRTFEFFNSDTFPRVHFADFSILDDKASEEPSLTFQERLSDKFGLLVDKNSTKVEVSLSPQTSVHPAQYVFLIKPIIFRHLEQREVYAAHAAAVTKNGQAILIVGKSRAGKSLLASMLTTMYGFEFISDETTLLDLKRFEVVGGNTIASLRTSRVNSEIMKCLAPYLVKSSRVTNKMYLDMRSSPINCQRIKYIIEPKLSFGDELSLTELPEFDSLISLYENVTVGIRSSVSFLYTLELALASQDNSHLSKTRIRRLKHVFKELSPKHLLIQGTPKHVCKAISNLVDEAI